jgi:hypothetical protein
MPTARSMPSSRRRSNTDRTSVFTIPNSDTITDSARSTYWVSWAEADPRRWEQRSRALAAALHIDHERLWAWCAALAPVVGRGPTT